MDFFSINIYILFTKSTDCSCLTEMGRLGRWQSSKLTCPALNHSNHLQPGQRAKHSWLHIHVSKQHGFSCDRFPVSSVWIHRSETARLWDFFNFFFRHILMTAFFVYHIKQLHSWRRQCNCVHDNRVRFYVSPNISFNYVAYIVYKWQGCGYRIMTKPRNKSSMLTKKTTEWGGAPPMSESRPWPAIAKIQR